VLGVLGLGGLGFCGLALSCFSYAFLVARFPSPGMCLAVQELLTGGPLP